jgi:serine/threonine protein phosphatase PrpC
LGLREQLYGICDGEGGYQLGNLGRRRQGGEKADEIEKIKTKIPKKTKHFNNPRNKI